MIDPYATLFRSVLLPAYETGLRRRKTLAYLHEYEASQWQSPEQIASLQWTKLQRLIEHCWEQVPYYRKLWQPLGIRAPADIASLSDFARLPVLDKTEIRANFDSLKATNQVGTLLYKTTGGSTGEPLKFAYTRESYERRVAIMWRGYGWSGARLGQRTVYLWGTPLGGQKLKERAYHAAFNRRVLNAFDMTDQRMAQYLEAIDQHRPETIVAYVAPMVRLAELLLAGGRRVHRPERILCAAEALQESQRRIIEEAFNCPAYNTYGCREFMLLAAECEHRCGLHVNADHAKVEVIGAGGPPDEPGDIVVTDLHNYGMPLLRYINGDIAIEGRESCACGRGLPLLAKVEGRRLDALRTRDGRFVPGELIVYAFLQARGVRRYQVVQSRLDAFDVFVVPDNDFDASSMDSVRAELSRVLGDGVALLVHYLDEIPLTATGKHRVTISELP
jgi:phenylacetate-CoA ligase